MIMDIGEFKIDIDVDKTNEYYKSISEFCDCASCRNYLKAIEKLPYEIKNFFHFLGIEMHKGAEVFIPYKIEGNNLQYDGFYHIVGTILHDPNPDKSYHSITNNLSVIFSTKTDLVAEEFPRPVIQLNFSMRLPWLLDEENTYN